MSQSGVDPTEKSYGVFVNSNQSSYLSTEKGNVSIPFQANLADHDPSKAVQIAMTSFLFTNTIFNITTENNSMNVIVYYAAGRGYPASKEEIPITIPPGFYNITQLSNYLSKSGVMGRELVQTIFRYGSNESFVNIFEGFGAIPLDPNDPIQTKAAPTNDSNTKIVFQSPDLAHMVQFGTDLTTPLTNNPPLKHSYIYSGIYVECPLEDTRYPPLLKMLGYFNINTAPAPLIEQSKTLLPLRYGYGMSFIPKQAATGVVAIDNTVYYQLKDLTQLPQNVILQQPQPFHGIIVTNESVVLTCAYELQAGKVIELENGFFVSGTSLSVPSPYVVGYQQCQIQGTLQNGSTDFGVIQTTPPNFPITVGMAIGVAYNETTKIPIDIGLADAFNYATGTTLPGLENSHCYYITADQGGGLYTLNQPYNSGTVTSPDLFAISYILTTIQLVTPGGLVENMLASPAPITDIAGVLTPSSVSNLSGVDEIHVHCSQLRTKNLSSTRLQPLAPADVIAVIPVEVEFGFKQNYQPPNLLTSYLSNTNVNQLDIELTDARGRPLNFNGVDWSCTFLISEVDAMNNTQLNSSGNFNTPFQDQLSTLEGTAQAQNKRQQREITFHDPTKKRNVGSHRPLYY
jgi:hypothetical protein